MLHAEKRLYLVFEFVDLDLKRHFDSNPAIAKDRRVIKVCVGVASAAPAAVTCCSQFMLFTAHLVMSLPACVLALLSSNQPAAAPPDIPAPDFQGRGVLPLA